MHTTSINFLNPNSQDNKGSWKILKDLYCSVTMLRELGLRLCYYCTEKVYHKVLFKNIEDQ